MELVSSYNRGVLLREEWQEKHQGICEEKSVNMQCTPKEGLDMNSVRLSTRGIAPRPKTDLICIGRPRWICSRRETRRSSSANLMMKSQLGFRLNEMLTSALAISFPANKEAHLYRIGMDVAP